MNIRKFSINQVIITNSNNTEIDITANFVSLDIYENLFQPFLTATLSFNDSCNLFEDLPFIGNETVYISLQINSEHDQLGIEWRDFKVLRIKFAALNNESFKKSKIYQLFIIEKEGLTALNEFSISFKDKIISEIVKTISTNILERTIETKNLEATKGTYSIAFPFMTPIEMINYVSYKYAQNSKNQYGYVYYTDIAQETHYQSINYLLNQTAKYNIFVDSKYSDNINNNSIREKSFEKMLDIDKNIKKGLFGNQEVYFDIENKKLVQIETTFSNFKIENNFLGTKTYFDKDIKDYKNMNISAENDVATQNEMLFSLLDNYNLLVKQEGNYAKKVGMIADIDLESFIADETETENNNFSGNWLCIRQVHRINSDGYNLYSTYTKNAFKIQKNLNGVESI